MSVFYDNENDNGKKKYLIVRMQARGVPVYSDWETKPGTCDESNDRAGDSRNTLPGDSQDTRGQKVSFLTGGERKWSLFIKRRAESI